MERLIRKLIRIGVVVEVNYEKSTCKVVFRDKSETQSKDLKVIFNKTKKNQTWDMPDLEEQVICIFLPNGSEEGFILGSVYSDINKGPANDNRKKYLFEDGTYFEYDKLTSTAKLYCVGDVEVDSDKNIKASAKENIEGTCDNASIEAQNNIEATCKSLSATASDSLTLTAPNITLDGEVSVTKNVTVAKIVNCKDTKTSKGSVNAHKHIGNKGAPTSPMI